MKKLLFTILLISLLVVTLSGVVVAKDKDKLQVERVEFSTTLADGNVYTIVGYAYSQNGNANNVKDCGSKRHTIQVLLAGATYSHRYWDAATINGIDYSYARYMAGQCYTVLALDRLGTGESSYPASGDFVTKDTEADALSQILTSLRTKNNPLERRYARIVLVGHSFGSFLAEYTLGVYPDAADALVATGWLNSPAPLPFIAAELAPLLATDYTGFPPEVRSLLFYYPPSADPDVIAYDNTSLAGPLPRGFFVEGLARVRTRAMVVLPVLADVASDILALTKADQIETPVLVQLADHDALFPSQPLPANEEASKPVSSAGRPR